MGLREYRFNLSKIKAERGDFTIEQALSSENIAWCLNRFREGDDWEMLRHRLGFGTSNTDIRWRKLKRELNRNFESEETSFEDYLSEVIESKERLHIYLEELTKIIENGPKNDFDRKNWPSYFKAIAEFEDKLSVFGKEKQTLRIEERKVRTLEDGKMGVTINILNQIPRPVREIEEKKS